MRLDFENLRGNEISAVCFVRDYIEFHFDGPVWRCLADPTILSDRGTVGRDDPGYKDRLCDLIGLTVIGTTVEEDDFMQCDLSGGFTIRIGLKAEDRYLGEAANFPRNRTG